MIETRAERLKGPGAGQYKFIGVIHTVCCMSMVLLSCVSPPTYSIWSSPALWSFIIAAKLFILAVTDVFIVRKGSGNVRDEKGSVSGLVKFQAVLGVLFLPIYLLGGGVTFIIVMDYRPPVIETILYYISFMSSMFVTCNCCYTICDLGGDEIRDTEPRFVNISTIYRDEAQAEPLQYTHQCLSAALPPSYTLYPCPGISSNQFNEDLPPSYTPDPQTDSQSRNGAVTERTVSATEITENTEIEQREIRRHCSLQTINSTDNTSVTRGQ